MNLIRLLALGEGVFYLLTGLWPVASRRTFEAVTGPKADFWRVRVLGTLIAAVGGVLVYGGLRRGQGSPSSELPLLGAAPAAALATADGIFVAQRRIPKVYLLDMAGELALIAGWLITWRK
ncbi:MAG TPA: hypothetical protein VFF68_13710 [Anaerolineaceae bacterium]|nr:hypothetical protein [Anaerolineaceae bacterium]